MPSLFPSVFVLDLPVVSTLCSILPVIQIMKTLCEFLTGNMSMEDGCELLGIKKNASFIFLFSNFYYVFIVFFMFIYFERERGRENEQGVRGK